MLFSILRMDDKTYIIGRSDEDEYVGFIMVFRRRGHTGGFTKTSDGILVLPS